MNRIFWCFLLFSFTFFLGCEQFKNQNSQPPSNNQQIQNTETQNYQQEEEKKPNLLLTSKQCVFAGLQKDFQIKQFDNGPYYYVEGTVMNSGNADAHNVQLIFRNTGASGPETLYLGTIKANSTKDFKSDYFQMNFHRAFDSFNINKDLSNYLDLSDPVFSSTELGD